MAVTHRLGLELLLRLIALNPRQAAEVMPLKAAMQAGTGQMRDDQLQGI